MIGLGQWNQGSSGRSRSSRYSKYFPARRAWWGLCHCLGCCHNLDLHLFLILAFLPSPQPHQNSKVWCRTSSWPRLSYVLICLVQVVEGISLCGRTVAPTKCTHDRGFPNRESWTWLGKGRSDAREPPHDKSLLSNFSTFLPVPAPCDCCSWRLSPLNH